MARKRIWNLLSRSNLSTFQGVKQSALMDVFCQWEGNLSEKSTLFPVFANNYRVRGMIGKSIDGSILWYPAQSATFHGEHFRLKAQFTDQRPLPLSEWEPGLLEGMSLCDPWQTLASILCQPKYGEVIGEWSDLFEKETDQGTIIDLEFESTLHILKGVYIRRGLRNPRYHGILELPPLAGSSVGTSDGNLKK